MEFNPSERDIAKNTSKEIMRLIGSNVQEIVSNFVGRNVLWHIEEAFSRPTENNYEFAYEGL
jgi:hypothetical protein